MDGKKKAKALIVCGKPEAQRASELKSKGRVVLKGILFDTGKDTCAASPSPCWRRSPRR
jgi:hypothetical protein